MQVPQLSSSGMSSDMRRIDLIDWVFAVRLGDLFQTDKWKKECKGLIILFLRQEGSLRCNLRKESYEESLILRPDIPFDEISSLSQLGIFDRHYPVNPEAIIADLKKEFSRLETS